MTKWYVTVDKYCSYPDENSAVWTLSRDPDDTGWETDSGFSGYGMMKADAEELANAADRIEALKAALLKIASNNAVKAGTNADMYKRWRKVATDGIDIARAALREKKDG